MLEAFIVMIEQMLPKITKLGIVGASFLAQWKTNRLIKKTNVLSSLPVRYFEDPEDAKTWLVSELE